MSEIDHPAHYGGADDPYEAIKVIEAWKRGFNDGNALKYIKRAGKKESSTRLVDIEKAIWYLQRESRNIRLSEAAQNPPGMRGS